MEPEACQPNNLQAEFGGSLVSSVPKLNGVFKDSMSYILILTYHTICVLRSCLKTQIKWQGASSSHLPCLQVRRQRSGRSWFQPSRTNSLLDPNLIIPIESSSGQVDQVVEHLNSKIEAPSSNLSITKKNF
jgi:hypothetical protein